MKYKNYFKAVLNLLLIVAFSTTIVAQERTTDFLKDYYRYNVFGQFTKNSKGEVFKEDSSILYTFDGYLSVQYGIIANIYQTKNWNFKTGLVIKPKAVRGIIGYTKEQTGLDVDLGFWYEVRGDDNMWSVPLIAEYVISISPKIKWMIAPSFTISIYKDYGGGGRDGIGEDPPAIFDFIYNDSSKKPIFTSAEISTGFYFLFKHFMLQTEIRYSRSFKDVKTGSYQTSNFRTTPSSSSGTFKQRGDYLGYSLTVYLKKKKD